MQCADAKSARDLVTAVGKYNKAPNDGFRNQFGNAVALLKGTNNHHRKANQVVQYIAPNVNCKDKKEKRNVRPWVGPSEPKLSSS